MQNGRLISPSSTIETRRSFSMSREVRKLTRRRNWWFGQESEEKEVPTFGELSAQIVPPIALDECVWR